jgi:exonuclease III
MPTDLDTYKPEKYIKNALFRPETKKAYKDLVDQGWTDAIRTLYPNDRVFIPFGIICGTRMAAMQAYDWTISY